MLEKVLDLFNALDVYKCCKCSTGKIIRAILVKEVLSKNTPNGFKGGPALLDTITGVPSAKKA
eukprot:4272146-Ditylum_brightwellii.AAC.1